METKIIPFDIELAKKILSGEIKGRILNNLKEEVRIVCFDREDPIASIIALFKVSGGEGVMYVREDGHAANCRDILVLEVADNEPQFKPFDKVLVRSNGFDKWKANFFSHMDDGYYKCVNSRYKECVLFDGNEHLVGTTDKPKEE